MAGYTSADLYGTAPLPTVVRDDSAPLNQGYFNEFGDGLKALIHPGNPLVIFGVILGITVGAVGVAGSARIGPVKVSGSAGKA